MATLPERIIEALGGVTLTRQQELISSYEQRLNRAYEQGFYDGNDEPPEGDIKSHGYRRATTNVLRDFTKMSHGKILDTVWSLWQSSPIAVRVMKLKRDHVIGRGVKPVTSDSDLQVILNDFWESNDLDKQSSNFALQLYLLGEQCYTAFVKESDGSVEIGYIDPAQIERVITHPENSMKRWVVVTAQVTSTDKWIGEQDKKVYRIIQVDDVVKGEEYQDKLVTSKQAELEEWELMLLKQYGLSEYSGDVFFTPHNALSNQPRGYSDLTSVADWIDACEETLFGLAELEQFRGYFSWFVKLMGVDPNSKEFANRVAQIRLNPPKKGSVNVTNDQEEWDLKVADLKQAGSIETFRALLGLILGGLGFPVHWFGFGDDANRATATVQATPTQKSLEHDQGEYSDMMVTMLKFVRDQAEIAGTLSSDEEADRSISITLPEINERDTAAIVNLLAPLATSLIAAIDAKWMSQEKATELWVRLVGELGIDIDPTAEMEKIANDADDMELGNAQDDNDRLKQLIDEVPLDGLPPEGTPQNLESVEGLNGAQITAVLTVLEQMSLGQLVPMAARELLISVGMSAQVADRIIELQKNVEPKTDDTQGVAIDS